MRGIKKPHYGAAVMLETSDPEVQNTEERLHGAALQDHQGFIQLRQRLKESVAVNKRRQFVQSVREFACFIHTRC